MTNSLGSFDPNILPMDAFELKGVEGDSERVISLKAPWKFEGESVSYPQSGFVSGRGWWTKFADGTLLQTGEATVTCSNNASNTWGSSSGTTYYGELTVVFPVDFYDVPPGLSALSEANAVNRTCGSYSKTTSQFQLVATAGSNSGQSVLCTWVAVGRWKA